MKQSEFVFFLALILLASCATKKNVLYFQDIPEEAGIEVPAPKPLLFHSGDMISIKVSSKDPQMSEAFNVSTSTSITEGLPVYLIDSKGFVKLPILGEVQVSEKNREQISNELEYLLIKRELLKDPIVIVGYVNFGVSVLGEVTHAGRVLITDDHTTLIDVLSQSGDLSIFGNRKKIKVLREENNQLSTYLVNLCSAKDLYASPVYYMKPNDIIYVEPNSAKSGSSTVNGNNVRTVSFWTSMGAFLISLANFLK